MANKYIRHGEAFNGDGTSSAAATVDGGVGAWNNINVFTGTPPAYGALAAGDVVNVRTLDNVGSPIAVSSAAGINLGSAAGTDLLPILWNFDNGIVWSGISGQVTITTTAQVVISVLNFNNIEASNARLALLNTYATFGNARVVGFGICNTSGLLVNISAQNASHGGTLDFASGTHTNIHITKKNSYIGLVRCSASDAFDALTLINPKLELLGSTIGDMGPLFVASSNYQGSFTVYGGECFGAGCVDQQAIASSIGNSSSIALYGFKYPRNMPLCSSAGNNSYVVSTGGDGAVGGSYFDSYFTSDSRSDGYYPTLNALLETSDAGGWSYKVYPYAVTQQKPARVSMAKLYSQTEAAKTITINFLWPQGLAAPTTDKVYMVAGYTDHTTGNKTYLSTKTPSAGAIAEVSAAWSTNTYGPTLFTKRSLSFTTPGSIKQNTEISVSLLIAVRSGSSSDIVFVDPDFTLT